MTKTQKGGLVDSAQQVSEEELELLELALLQSREAVDRMEEIIRERFNLASTTKIINGERENAQLC